MGSDKKIINSICKKLLDQEKVYGFIRHIDKTTMANTPENLMSVTMKDIFDHPDWAIDYVCELSQEELIFFRNNMDMFERILINT